MRLVAGGGRFAREDEGAPARVRDGRFELLRGIDPAKDQSYCLLSFLADSNRARTRQPELGADPALRATSALGRPAQQPSRPKENYEVREAH